LEEVSVTWYAMPTSSSSFKLPLLEWGVSGLVALEDGSGEVVAEESEEVDVIEVAGAAEAVGEVVAGVDSGERVAAVSAEEEESAVADLGGRAVTTKGGEGDGHG
jgi:hypothetical protein